ncbi:RHS repeat protein [Hymenobacter sp. 15J16-1T3B]|uniref:RHS repeat protein n=1 Tax=Hymenobacter sp. 15J16-1T3B TaxID=2886941 RepID=UPI001D11AB0D|nr:RHS repeat domain-containing protein [Hymenobacter sp. 15J16-1T3B]MCC3157163.1 RHS repeat protein [Hymenobacter sp. 15J16-1T3B]
MLTNFYSALAATQLVLLGLAVLICRRRWLHFSWKRQLLLPWLGLSPLVVQAQSGPISAADLLPPSFLPKSPTAGALVGFSGQQLVNLPTGGAQFSVALAEVSCGALRLPVSLGYSFTGLQVGQPYDLVGLGWSLQAGACITRQVNGLLDEDVATLPERRYNPDSVRLGRLSQWYLRRAILNDVDTGPDVYTFSLPGGTNGRFIIRDTTVVLLPQQPVHVERIGAGTSWGFQVTTEDGIRFQFQAVEVTRPDPHNFGPIGQHPSAWHLTRMISANNADTVQLHYTRSAFESQPQQCSITTGKYYTGVYEHGASTGTDYGAGCGSAADYAFHNVQMYVSKVQAQYLDSITTRGAHLVLTRAANHELQRLRLIATTNGRREVKRVVLYQSHFAGEPASPDYRLRLDSLRESANGSALPCYQFRYHNIVNMPSRRSAAKDFWGYFNGATRNGDVFTTAVPSLLADPRLNQIAPQFAADRTPNYSFALAGALKEVTYPTGGTTRWEYEPGRVSSTLEQIPMDSTTVTLGTSYNSNNTVLTSTGKRVTTSGVLTFRVTQTADVNLYLSRLPADSINTCGSCNTFRDFNLWRRLATGDSLITDGPESAFKSQDPETGRRFRFHLPAGNYAAEVYCESRERSTNIFLQLAFRDSSLVRLGLPGPGVRVLRTTTTTPGAPPLVRTYRYTANGYCSGASLLPENGTGFESYNFLDVYQTSGQIAGVSGICHNVSTSSDNRGIGNDFNKYDFYYACVTETLGENQGWTEHYYTHLAEQFNDVVPVREAVYRQDANQPRLHLLAQETRYTYATDSVLVFPLMKVRVAETHARDIFHLGVELYEDTPLLIYPHPYWGLPRRAEPYEPSNNELFAAFVAPVQTEQLRYDTQGSVSVSVSRSTYKRQRLIHSATRTSTGWDIRRYKRLWDYAAAPSTAPLRRSYFNPVVETQAWRRTGTADSVLVGGQLTFFDPQHRAPAGAWSLRLPQPAAAPNRETLANGYFAGFKSDTRYRPDDSVRYDSGTGLLLQRQSPKAPPIAYIWGYDRTHVVAQVENATYAAVQAVLSPATIARLQSANPGTDTQIRQLLAPLRTQLPQARVTVYTYAPLVGLTSQTDPSGRTNYYEYDELGRLLRVRDEQSHILSEQEYHYARPN